MVSLLCIFADAALEEESLLFFALWTGLLAINSLNPSPRLKQCLGFPLGLLIFCLPVPQYVAFYHFHYPLQRLSTLWTAGMLDLTGFPATVSGTLVNIGSHSMHIAEECSGIKFLAILMLFAAVAGHLYLQKSAGKRILLLSAAIPVAIMTNIIRLTVAGIIMSKNGEKAAMAFLHGNSVLIFYTAAVFLLAVLVRVSATVEDPLSSCPKEPEAIRKTKIDHHQPVDHTGFFALIIVWSLSAAIGSNLAQSPAESDFNRTGLINLELVPAGWNSIKSSENTVKTYTPGFSSAKQNRQLTLSAPSGHRYSLEVVWWPQRRPRNRLIVFHQAVICSMGIYAGGIHSEMQIADQNLSYSLITENGHRKSFYYWLQSENQISIKPYYHALWQYRRELFRQPSDGCFVLIAADGQIKDTSSLELKTLIKHIRETLQKWLSHN